MVRPSKFLNQLTSTIFCFSVTKKMHCLLEAVNRHAAAVGVRINASKIKMMSALIPGEQRQTILPEGKPSEDVDGFKYFHLLSFYFNHKRPGHRRNQKQG